MSNRDDEEFEEMEQQAAAENMPKQAHAHMAQSGQAGLPNPDEEEEEKRLVEAAQRMPEKVTPLISGESLEARKEQASFTIEEVEGENDPRLLEIYELYKRVFKTEEMIPLQALKDLAAGRRFGVDLLTLNT